MGHAVLRYSRNPVACAIDFNHNGSTTRDLLDFGPDVPGLASGGEAVGVLGTGWQQPGVRIHGGTPAGWGGIACPAP